MRNTCIQHPVNDLLLIIRHWQLELCEGNHCAAALLSFFEYWHNIRLDMSQRAGSVNAAARQQGKPAIHDESLLQFHSDEQLQAGLLALYGTMKIREARRVLVAKGVITEHLNPKPRYAFDRTIHYLFHPEVVNLWLAQRHSSSPPEESASSSDDCIENATSAKNGDSSAKNGDSSAKNGDSPHEITTEITYEITTETTTTTPNPSVANESIMESEPAHGNGRGTQDKKTKGQDPGHGIAALKPDEEKTVQQRKVSPDPITGTDSTTATETLKTVIQEERHNGPWPKLAYPAKLTAAEYADITAQIDSLPTEIAQQMLDVIECKIKSGQIKTNPAALLRGVIRKYQTDPNSFDPSSGFHIADQRRQRRAESEARLQAEAEARTRSTPPQGEVRHSRLSPVGRQSLDFMLKSLRGYSRNPPTPRGTQPLNSHDAGEIYF